MSSESTIPTTSRRAALRSIFSLGSVMAVAPVALAAVPPSLAHPVALAAVPPSLAHPSGLPESPELLALGARVVELEKDRERALGEAEAAFARFEALAPERPEALFLYGSVGNRRPQYYEEWYTVRERDLLGRDVERGPVRPGLGGSYRMVFCAAQIRAKLPNEATPKKWGKRILAAAEKYDAAVERARDESGFSAASSNLCEMHKRAAELAAHAFEFSPRTTAGLIIQARAFAALRSDRFFDGRWGGFTYGHQLMKNIAAVPAA